MGYKKIAVIFIAVVAEEQQIPRMSRTQAFSDRGGTGIQFGKHVDLSVSDKKRYYEELRDYCKAASEKYKTDITLPQRIMAKIGKGLRNFDIEIIGRENMPKDGCLVVCNHSNTHDAFLAAEVLYKVGVPSSFLAGIEGLSRAEIALLKSARATMISRNDKESTINGVCDFSSKLLKSFFNSFIVGKILSIISNFCIFLIYFSFKPSL